MILTIDIETIPTSDLSVIEEIAASIKPPGNIKKAESIAAWNLDEKPAAIEEAVKKTSFNGALGSVVCIGAAFDDGEPWSYCAPDEKYVLNEFLDFLAGNTRERDHLIIVGHNVGSFDLRFLWQRFIVNKFKPPRIIPWSAKPWSDSIADTMLMWNPDREKRISLDNLCKTLGVQTSKNGIDGSMIADYAQQGRYDEIAQYCRDDVRATRECYWRMTR